MSGSNNWKCLVSVILSLTAVMASLLFPVYDEYQFVPLFIRHSYRSVLLLLQLMTQTGMWNMTTQLNLNPFKAASDRLNVGFNRPRSSHTQPRNRETIKKQYTCQVCNAVFRTWGGRYYHMAKHTGKYRFCCDLCDRGFMRSDEYRNHMKTHRRVIQASLKK